MADQDEKQLLEEAQELLNEEEFEKNTAELADDTSVDSSTDELTSEPAEETEDMAPEVTRTETTPDEYDTEVANELPDTDTQDNPNDQTASTSISERGSGSKKLSGHIVITKTDDPKASWFVVHSSSGHEARVAESLRQRVETMKFEGKVFEVLIPTQDTIKVKQGKKYTVKEKIFPGYILVKMILDEDAWLAVRTTPGITGFVGIGNKPTPLSESEVSNITKFVSSPAARYKVKFSVGEAIKITDGPFSQQLATISEMDEDKGRVKVLVSIFGRETPVDLDFLQIAKI